MKKPDRFERIAGKLRLEYIASPWVIQIPNEAWVDIEHRITKLLRAEHGWMRRVVRREMLSEFHPAAERITGWNQALIIILDQLAQRRK